MILKRIQYNNGYGCQCCRRDWEEVEWVDEKEASDIKTFFKENLPLFHQNCNAGGKVGIKYQKEGVTVFGIEADIYKMGWDFYACKGEVDFEDTVKIPVKYENGTPSFDLSVLDSFYGLS